MRLLTNWDVDGRRCCWRAGGRLRRHANPVPFGLARVSFYPLESAGAHKATKVKAGKWVVGKLVRELGINATGGSFGVADAWGVLRTAAATTLAAGASRLQWQLPIEELTITEGVVSHSSANFLPDIRSWQNLWLTRLPITCRAWRVLPKLRDDLDGAGPGR